VDLQHFAEVAYESKEFDFLATYLRARALRPLGQPSRGPNDRRLMSSESAADAASNPL